MSLSLIVLLLGLGFVGFKIFPVRAFVGGDGSSGSPYQITDCTDLQAIGTNLSASYILNNNIDCSGVADWTPIGTFTGSLDGNDKTISNITNGGSRSNNGLFSIIYGGTVTDLTITGINLQPEGWGEVGGLAGQIQSDETHLVTIDNVHTSGTVNGGWNTGGLIGKVSGASASIINSSSSVIVLGWEQVGGLVGYSESPISNCFATGSVTGQAASIGGLVGYTTNAVSNSYATGDVSGIDSVAGLIGSQSDSGLTSVTYSYATGSVTGGRVAVEPDIEAAGNSTGGLIGYSRGPVTNSYATGNVVNLNPNSNDGFGIGGLIGTSQNNTTIDKCYATGTATGNFSVGGFIGAAYNNPTITQSYAIGTVAGNYRVGGFIGTGDTTISNSYAMGNVTGSDDVGGFVGGWGWSNTTISYSYSKGSVSGVNAVGGFIGNKINGTVSNSYYDTETSGQSDNDGRGIPKSTAQMKSTETFTGWDFSTIWSISVSINDGYPINYESGVASDVATVTSSIYTVSAGGTQNETITNVVYGTTKTDFLNAINKGNIDQTWDSSNVSDPVVTDNTLVVTAEDGITIVTYTITVNPDLNHIATIFSSIYTVSAGGTSNETISNIQLGISKAVFLSALSKGDVTQTWDDSAIHDPVEPGDILIVTAEDGTTIVNYTIAIPNFSGSGDGTSDSPYQVTSCTQLQEIAYHLSSHYILTSNIDCSSLEDWHNGEGFVPIGISSSNPFIGTLNGQGYTISNLTIAKTSEESGSSIGIFGDIEGATIRNFSIQNLNITAVNFSNVGGVVGSSGMVSLTQNTITEVDILSGSVIGEHIVGGLIGYLNGSNDIVSYSSTNVAVNGTGSVGGLIGKSSPGTSITYSYTTEDINTSVPATGGLVGYNLGNISNCYSTADIVSPNLNIGGLVGLNGGNVSKSYALGNVSGLYYVGGLIGLSYGVVTNTYALGNVLGTDYVGGNIGRDTSDTALSYSYSIGSVTASSGTNVGGLEGVYEGTGAVSYSYYNSETSGMSDTGKGVPKTTEQMKIKANYANWDFLSTWNINSEANNGYPFFGFYGLGGGSELNPYQISSCSLLQGMQYDLSANYILTTNIDCQGFSWIPIGTGYLPDPFTGTLDGNDKIVRNLSTTGTSGDMYVGFFGKIDSAEIKDLTLENFNVLTDHVNGVGILAGSSGIASGGLGVGGSVISNVHVIGGKVTGDQDIGGLVGILGSSSDSITLSSSSANVFGDISGGLVGYVVGSITDSYATGDVSGTGSGGLAGGAIGGPGMNIQRCYATGDVTGDDDIGGFIGTIEIYPLSKDSSLIKDCYSTGNVTESSEYRDGYGIGGFMGYSRSGTIQNSYSIGVVNSGNPSETSGGFVGYFDSVNSDIVSSYWNTQTSGYLTGIGGVGLTTAQIKIQSSFVNWDFNNIWVLDFPFKLSSNPSGGGVILSSGDFLNIPTFGNQTKQVTFTAIPSTWYLFDNWSESGSILSTNTAYTTSYTGRESVTRDIVANFHYTFVAPIIHLVDDIVDNGDPEVVPEVELPPIEEEIPLIDSAPEDEQIGENQDTAESNPVGETFVEKSAKILTDVVSVLATSITAASQQVSEKVKSIPISEDTSQSISATALAVVVVTPVVSASLGSSYSIAFILKSSTIGLALLGLGKKKRNCGMVYNSVTKEPIKNAVVRIYKTDGALVTTEVTNQLGIFESDIETGEYKITINASGYKFPSNIVIGTQDLPYENVYTGGNFIYNSSSTISYSIPIDPLNKNIAEEAIVIVRNGIVKFVNSTANIFVFVGLLFTVISYIKLSSTLNLILLIVYIAIVIIGIVMRRQERYRYGKVTDLSGNPVRGVEIGLMETEFNTILAKRVTNDHGKYRFITPGGSYKLVSLNPQYSFKQNEDIIVEGKKNKIIAISKNLTV